MNLVVLGLFSMSFQGLQGCLLLMLGHGLTSGALFLLGGVIYERNTSRYLGYLGGIVQLMPLFSFSFFFFNICNMGFPGSFSFIGEFLIFMGIFEVHLFFCLFSGMGVILSAVYSLLLFNSSIFGTFKIKFFSFCMCLFFMFLFFLLS